MSSCVIFYVIQNSSTYNFAKQETDTQPSTKRNITTLLDCKRDRKQYAFWKGSNTKFIKTL